MDGEGEGGEEGFEARDEEVPGDARHGAKVLELRDFVDDVEDVDALLAAVVAEVVSTRRWPGLPLGCGLRRTPMATGVARVLRNPPHPMLQFQTLTTHHDR